jgi:hypothetical protein
MTDSRVYYVNESIVVFVIADFLYIPSFAVGCVRGSRQDNGTLSSNCSCESSSRNSSRTASAPLHKTIRLVVRLDINNDEGGNNENSHDDSSLYRASPADNRESMESIGVDNTARKTTCNGAFARFLARTGAQPS